MKQKIIALFVFALLSCIRDRLRLAGIDHVLDEPQLFLGNAYGDPLSDCHDICQTIVRSILTWTAVDTNFTIFTNFTKIC